MHGSYRLVGTRASLLLRVLGCGSGVGTGQVYSTPDGRLLSRVVDTRVADTLVADTRVTDTRV